MESNSSSFKYGTKIVERVEKKYGAKDWEEFDKLEQADREKLSSDASLVSQGKKKKRRPSRKQKKLSQISQYQKALKKLRTGVQMFHSPFERQKLNLQYMPVLKMLQKAYEHEVDLQQTLKKTGLKTAKILFKTGARINIFFMLTYLKQNRIPDWIIKRHRQMMKKRDDQFNSDQNSLLRTMSSSQNTCLQTEL